MKYRKIDHNMLGRSFCRGKKIYDKKGAITVKNFRGKKQQKGYLRIYQCNICGYWHLTHHEYEKSRNKKEI